MLLLARLLLPVEAVLYSCLCLLMMLCCLHLKWLLCKYTGESWRFLVGLFEPCDVSARAAAAVKQCPEPSPVVGSCPPADVPVFEPLPRAYPSPYPDPGALAHSAAALSTITPRENCDGRSVSPETKLQPVNYSQRALPQPEREQQQQHLQVCKISDEEQDLYRPYFPRTSHRCVFHRDLHHLAIAQTPD